MDLFSPAGLRSRLRRLFLIAALSTLALIALGCSSSSNKTATSTGTSIPPPSVVATVVSATPTTTVAPTATAAATGGVSGSWSGKYSGAYSGTFTLTWQQSGPNLTGTIAISSFGNAPTPINGTLQGNSINFGTVGSQAITYTGTVSGNSMSGSWQIQGGGGGSWSASK